MRCSNPTPHSRSRRYGVDNRRRLVEPRRQLQSSIAITHASQIRRLPILCPSDMLALINSAYFRAHTFLQYVTIVMLTYGVRGTITDNDNSLAIAVSTIDPASLHKPKLLASQATALIL